MTQTAFRCPERRPVERGHVSRATFSALQRVSLWVITRRGLALTHHALVWLAAWRVHPGKRFWDYAILGDDIVIADQGVAEEYQKIMKDAEVTISKEKSLISFTGAMEFAKRFITDWGTQDFSPVSFKVLNLTGGFVPAFIFQVLRVSLQTSYRLRGGSYRVYTNRGTPKSSLVDGCDTGYWRSRLVAYILCLSTCGSRSLKRVVLIL